MLDTKGHVIDSSLSYCPPKLHINPLAALAHTGYRREVLLASRPSSVTRPD